MSIVSNKLRESAGHYAAHCMLNIEGVCGDSTEDKTAGCVLAHIRYCGNAGGGQKPSDISGSFSCGPCHTAFDGNGTTKGLVRGSEEWLHYAMRGMQRTQDWWVKHGFLTIKGVR